MGNGIHGSVDNGELLSGEHALIKADTVEIGKTSDSHRGSSLGSIIHLMNDHLHHVSRCYPDRANSIVVAKASGVWAEMGTPTEIIPADAIPLDFDIHFASIINLTTNGEYIMFLYSGEAGSEVFEGCVDFAKSAGGPGEGAQPTGSIVIPEKTRISAALTGSMSQTATAAVRLRYHYY